MQKGIRRQTPLEDGGLFLSQNGFEMIYLAIGAAYIEIEPDDFGRKGTHIFYSIKAIGGNGIHLQVRSSGLGDNFSKDGKYSPVTSANYLTLGANDHIFGRFDKVSILGDSVTTSHGLLVWGEV